MVNDEKIYIFCPHCDGETICKRLCCCDATKSEVRVICKVCQGEGQIPIEKKADTFWTFQFHIYSEQAEEDYERLYEGLKTLLPKNCVLSKTLLCERRISRYDKTEKPFGSLSISAAIEVILAVRKYIEKVVYIKLL